MRFSKHTPDRYFKITVESDLLSEDENENEHIPSTSMEALILELELLASELRNLLVDEKISQAN